MIGVMDEYLAEVIPLRPDADCGPLTIQDKPRRYCGHRDTSIDAVAKRVYCRECGSEIPAFDALMVFASDYERYVKARQHAIRAAQLEQDKLADLHRQVRNAKAQLRRVTA